jgi:D-3-phosphoglycerate dehydrogenase
MKTSFPKKDIKILLLEGIHQSAIEVFRAAGYSLIEHHDKALPRAELLDAVADAHIIGLRSRTQLDAEAIGHARRLLAVGCFCIGTNQVDLHVARERGAPVFKAP